MSEIQGIDVSSWQGDIQWDRVKRAGIGFAMIRVSAGTHGDRQFQKNIQGAQKQGIPCGIYLYSVADNVAATKAEATYALATVKPYTLQLPIAFDIEDKIQNPLSDAQRTDLIDAFCHQVGSAGYRPMIYSSLSWFQTMFELPRLTAYDKWVAQWGVSRCSFQGTTHMWQYSSSGQVDGISGNVDRNVAYVDYTATQSPAAKPVIPVVQPPVQKPVIPVVKSPDAKPAAPVAQPPVQKPTIPVVKSPVAGQRLTLRSADLYVSTSAVTKRSSVSGSYWVYDGKVQNGRIRITNSADKVGKLPMDQYVTGYIRVTEAIR